MAAHASRVHSCSDEKGAAAAAAMNEGGDVSRIFRHLCHAKGRGKAGDVASSPTSELRSAKTQRVGLCGSVNGTRLKCCVGPCAGQWTRNYHA